MNKHLSLLFIIGVILTSCYFDRVISPIKKLKIVESSIQNGSTDVALDTGIWIKIDDSEFDESDLYSDSGIFDLKIYIYDDTSKSTIEKKIKFFGKTAYINHSYNIGTTYTIKIPTLFTERYVETPKFDPGYKYEYKILESGNIYYELTFTITKSESFDIVSQPPGYLEPDSTFLYRFSEPIDQEQFTDSTYSLRDNTNIEISNNYEFVNEYSILITPIAPLTGIDGVKIIFNDVKNKKGSTYSNIFYIFKKVKVKSIIDFGGGSSLNANRLIRPISVSVDSMGNIFVLDSETKSIFKYSSDLKFIKKWDKYGPENTTFIKPTSLTVTKDDLVVVLDDDFDLIVFDNDGTFIKIKTRYGERFPTINRGNVDGTIAYIEDQNLKIFNMMDDKTYPSYYYPFISWPFKHRSSLRSTEVGDYFAYITPYEWNYKYYRLNIVRSKISPDRYPSTEEVDIKLVNSFDNYVNCGLSLLSNERLIFAYRHDINIIQLPYSSSQGLGYNIDVFKNDETDMAGEIHVKENILYICLYNTGKIRKVVLG